MTPTSPDMPTNDGSDWQQRLAAHVGARVRELRKRERLTAQDVADQCTNVLGFKLLRTTLANLEAGTRKNVTLGEVLVLAEAVGTSPAALLFPVIGADSVEYLPGDWTSPWDALDRLTHPLMPAFSGRGMYPHDADDETRAMHLLAVLEQSETGWLMFKRWGEQVNLPDEVKETYSRQMDKMASGARTVVSELMTLGADLDPIDPGFLAAVRRQAESGDEDA